MSSRTPRLLSSLIVLICVGCSYQLSTPKTQSLPKLAISPDKLWARVDPKLVFIDTLKLSPKVYEAFELDTDALSAAARRAPLELADDAHEPLIITLPVPSGSFTRFKVVESPIIEPKLAERYPWLKSYKAIGLDDRTAVTRFELTHEGLHAMVLSSSGTFFIDPASRKNPRQYVSYLKSDLPDDPNRLRCGVREARVASALSQQSALAPRISAARSGFLRVYQLAVAASHRYVAAIHNLNNPNGSSQDLLPDALTAIHRTVNRIDLIYETELGIQLVLVGDEDKIIFTEEAGDPYVDSDTDDHLLDGNQVVLDQRIGSQNYDVGHLFLGRGGGRSSEPCVCSQFFKAQGLTGRVEPQGDAFDVDYVAHEVGHEFGASHSFNGTSLRCDRNATTAYEPGSGSTIMGYAGPTLCGPESIQNHSDAYFHAISMSEINSFISNSDPNAGGDSCAQKVPNGDSQRPVVNAGVDRIIPRDTPFTLTVASSSDGDGDALVYSWEEFDLGEPDPPVSTDPLDIKKIRPIFRTRRWNSDLSRTFPLLADILVKPVAGTFTAESLPPQKRTMKFRVTVRDLRGRYGFDDMRVTVVADRRITGAGVQAVGPFVVTRPLTSVTWKRNSQQTVRWNVANTNGAPVKCSSVKISLLMKGDESHPIILVTSTPNNGSRILSVPANLLLGSARVKVEAVNNVFFNLSQADIEITP